MPSPAVPLVRVERGGLEEALHAGHLAIVNSEGQIRASLGEPEVVTYFRSCAKPFQAIASLRGGIAARFALAPEHLAIMAASHNGEPRHIEAVRGLLRHADVPENTLRCGAHWPYYEPAADVARHEMRKPLAIFNNCSGKHAGMLAAAQAFNAPLETYLHPDHPVQAGIRQAIEEFTGSPADRVHWGTDGCSAPNAAVPLAAMARAFALLVRSQAPEARAVVDAMTSNPFLIGGTDRFDTRLMEATKGRLLAKGGAAGAHCTANRETGEGLAVKFSSGDGTWVPVAVMASLQQLRWLEASEADGLRSFAEPSLRNWNHLAVGSVRPVFELPVTAA